MQLKIFASAETRRQTFRQLTVVTFMLGGVYFIFQRYTPATVSDPVAIQEWIASFGVLAPLVFILIQFVQVIVAPIPGQLTALFAGYLFGAILGTVYSLIGVITGSTVVFVLTKRYGRPYVERMLDSNVIERFDGFIEKAGVPGLFVFFLIPGLPDDVLCFLGGLTRIRLRTFLVIVTVGRLPAYVLVNFAGERFANGRLTQAIIVLGVVATLSLVAYLNRETLVHQLRD